MNISLIQKSEYTHAGVVDSVDELSDGALVVAFIGFSVVVSSLVTLLVETGVRFTRTAGDNCFAQYLA